MIALVMVGVSVWAGAALKSYAQLGPVGTQILGGVISQIPTLNQPLIISPYVLDTANIVKNVNNNLWTVPYNVPPNTQSMNFTIQVNGMTPTGVQQAQFINNQLVFRVPDSAFLLGGSAIISLVQKNPFKIISQNVIMVAGQALQPSPFIFNQQSLTQNEDGSWNIGYYIPPNTNTSQYALTVGSNSPVMNAQAVYGGMVFRVPENWFNSGSVLLLVLVHQPTMKIVATNVGFVPVSGPSQYILDPASIMQNQNGTWDVGYRVPTNTTGGHFSLTAGTAPMITNGAVANGRLVFKVPEDVLKPGASIALKLTQETTGQVRANDLVTIPSGLPPQIILNFPPTKEVDRRDEKKNIWRVSYQVPPDTVSTEYSLLVGSTGTVVTGGLIVNNTLVFIIPEEMFSPASTSKVFILKHKPSGKLYNADGSFTQGTPEEEASSDLSKYVGGLLITFPPTGQSINQTYAAITANLRAVIDLPFVDTSYIWNKKDGDPSQNIEKQLIKIPGPTAMKAGDEETATLMFSNLTPGQVYSFVLKNNVTNTISDVIEFKATSDTLEKSYLNYSGGYIDGGAGTGDPNPVEPVIDDISDKGIVPLCGRTWTKASGLEPNDKRFQPCGLEDFLQLISNVIRYALIIFGPIVAILVAITGFQVIWYGRLPDPTAEQSAAFKAAKARLVKIAIGLVIMLSGWIIIATITRELGVRDSYTLLDLITGN